MFKEWAEKWLEEKRKYVKESTYANYRIIMLNHLIPEFGKQFIEQIEQKDIQMAVLKWMKQGRVDHCGGLSVKTIKDMIMVLKMCLSEADTNGQIFVGKRGITYPEKNLALDKRCVLSEMEYQSFVNAIYKNPGPESLGYILCLYTGMRIGEICALQWKDINIEERVISISKTIQRIYIKNTENKGLTKILITPPKSKKSFRKIPIADAIFDLLKSSKREENIYVVTERDEYIEPRLYRKHYYNFMKENSLEYIKFHGLRHTFATRCIEAGADYKVVSELLGHSSVNLTLNLYVHPRMEDKRKCVNLL